MFRRIAFCVLAVAALAACGGDDDDDDDAAPAPTTTTVAPDDENEGWDPAALAVAEELAQSIEEAGTACDDYTVDDFVLLAADYENKLPMPLTSSSCVGPGGEDFTFEVFEDADAREDFVASKLQVICTTVAEEEIEGFPGLPVVAGENWLIEPDEEGSANALAAIVGGEAAMRTCPESS